MALATVLVYLLALLEVVLATVLVTPSSPGGGASYTVLVYLLALLEVVVEGVNP